MPVGAATIPSTTHFNLTSIRKSDTVDEDLWQKLAKRYTGASKTDQDGSFKVEAAFGVEWSRTSLILDSGKKSPPKKQPPPIVFIVKQDNSHKVFLISVDANRYKWTQSGGMYDVDVGVIELPTDAVFIIDS